MQRLNGLSISYSSEQARKEQKQKRRGVDSTAWVAEGQHLNHTVEGVHGAKQASITGTRV